MTAKIFKWHEHSKSNFHLSYSCFSAWEPSFTPSTVRKTSHDGGRLLENLQTLVAQKVCHRVDNFFILQQAYCTLKKISQSLKPPRGGIWNEFLKFLQIKWVKKERKKLFWRFHQKFWIQHLELYPIGLSCTSSRRLKEHWTLKNHPIPSPLKCPIAFRSG